MVNAAPQIPGFDQMPGGGGFNPMQMAGAAADGAKKAADAATNAFNVGMATMIDTAGKMMGGK